MIKNILNFLISCLLVIGLLSLATISIAVSVGVHSGDWAEYNASYIGSPSDYFINWTRIEVNEIQGSNLTVYITGEFLNGKYDTQQGFYNLQTGIPGLFIIPANLEVNNQFFHEDYGNITIEGTKEVTCVNSKRTAIYSTVNQTKLHWDKTTGVLLQLDVSWNNFSQKIVIEKTNMWESQPSEIDPINLFTLSIVAIVVLLVLCYVLKKRRKKMIVKSCSFLNVLTCRF